MASLYAPGTAPSPTPAHGHKLAQPEFLHIPSPAKAPLGYPDAHAPNIQPREKPQLEECQQPGQIFPPLGRASVSPSPSQRGYFSDSPFTTPSTARRMDFNAIPQSPTHKAPAYAFGLSPGHATKPSPSWEYTPDSQVSRLPSPVLALTIPSRATPLAQPRETAFASPTNSTKHAPSITRSSSRRHHM